MSLVIENKDYFDSVMKFARDTGQEANLQESLDYLGGYACHDGDSEATHCLLYKDGAPQSFGFAMQKRRPDGTYVHWFNGGLLFHGSHDGYGSGAAPTFAVSLTPVSGWSIHT